MQSEPSVNSQTRCPCTVYERGERNAIKELRGTVHFELFFSDFRSLFVNNEAFDRVYTCGSVSGALCDKTLRMLACAFIEIQCCIRHQMRCVTTQFSKQS